MHVEVSGGGGSRVDDDISFGWHPLGICADRPLVPAFVVADGWRRVELFVDLVEYVRLNLTVLQLQLDLGQPGVFSASLLSHLFHVFLELQHARLRRGLRLLARHLLLDVLLDLGVLQQVCFLVDAYILVVLTRRIPVLWIDLHGLLAVKLPVSFIEKFVVRLEL